MSNTPCNGDCEHCPLSTVHCDDDKEKEESDKD